MLNHTLGLLFCTKMLWSLLRPRLQVPATCPYPKPDQSSLCPSHPTSWRSISISSSHLCLGIPSGLFPPRILHRNPVRTSPLPLRAHHILLDL